MWRSFPLQKGAGNNRESAAADSIDRRTRLMRTALQSALAVVNGNLGRGETADACVRPCAGCHHEVIRDLVATRRIPQRHLGRAGSSPSGRGKSIDLSVSTNSDSLKEDLRKAKQHP